MAPDRVSGCTCGKSLADFNTTASATDLESCRVHGGPTLHDLSRVAPEPAALKVSRRDWEGWGSRFRR